MCLKVLSRVSLVYDATVSLWFLVHNKTKNKQAKKSQKPGEVGNDDCQGMNMLAGHHGLSSGQHKENLI